MLRGHTEGHLCLGLAAAGPLMHVAVDFPKIVCSQDCHIISSPSGMRAVD